MSTKADTKYQGSKKQGAGKKGTSKKDDRRRQQQIPPIVVGGGGSMLIWVLKGLDMTQLGTPPNVTYLNPQIYNCYQVGASTDELTRATVNRGQGGGNPTPHALNRGHNTKFDKA